MKIEEREDFSSFDKVFTTSIPGDMVRDELPGRVLQLIAERIADRVLEEEGDRILAEVLSLIDPRAIATMTMAEAGAAVNRTLKEKIPDKVLKVYEREVYQKGILGGLKRVL